MRINNPALNSIEFEGIKNQAGRNSFYLSAKKWIDRTGARGLIVSADRYGGTDAHKDIAFTVATPAALPRYHLRQLLPPLTDVACTPLPRLRA